MTKFLMLAVVLACQLAAVTAFDSEPCVPSDGQEGLEQTCTQPDEASLVQKEALLRLISDPKLAPVAPHNAPAKGALDLRATYIADKNRLKTNAEQNKEARESKNAETLWGPKDDRWFQGMTHEKVKQTLKAKKAAGGIASGALGDLFDDLTADEGARSLLQILAEPLVSDTKMEDEMEEPCDAQCEYLKLKNRKKTQAELDEEAEELKESTKLWGPKGNRWFTGMTHEQVQRTLAMKKLAGGPLSKLFDALSADKKARAASLLEIPEDSEEAKEAKVVGPLGRVMNALSTENVASLLQYLKLPSKIEYDRDDKEDEEERILSMM